MQTAYAQKNETAQRAADNTAAAVHDNSPQSESLQRHASLANAAVQRAENPPRPNNTGLPDDLKNGIESLSGYSLDNVRVHYNSPKPATVQALAYTQGTDIHVAPGQEYALPHEAWHVTQQMAGRVTPTTNIGGMPVNDNAALEHEADVMGEKAVQCKRVGNVDDAKRQKNGLSKCCTLQRIVIKGCSKGGGSFSFNAEKMRLLIFYKKMVDSEIIKITEIGSKTTLPDDWYNQKNWENFKKYLDLDIKDCQSFQDILNKIADVEGLLNDAKEKKRIRDSAFAESHNQKTYDNYNKKREKQNFDSFFETEFQKNVLIYSNADDVQHQIAQDYLLKNAGLDDLVGIKHQFEEYFYSEKTSATSGTNMRIYRTMPLDEFNNGCLHGHGGPLGMALMYDAAPPWVMVEFTFEKEFDMGKIESEGSGSEPTVSALGRKSESQSCLPQRGFNGATTNTKQGLNVNEYNGIFSFNFGNKKTSGLTNANTIAFMKDKKPEMKVVHYNLNGASEEQCGKFNSKRNETSCENWIN